MMNLLKQTFIELVSKYTDEIRLTEKLWDEIHLMYSSKSRHYHTISHLDNLLLILENIRNKIIDWDTLLFAVYYHDIVYKATSKENEENSANIAMKRLSEIRFPQERIKKCISMILATKKHTLTNDNDTDYFTDADLSILGQNWEVYSQYAKQVRQEYLIYPDLIYIPGRKKVINHFLK